jgi:hypothetical protein
VREERHGDAETRGVKTIKIKIKIMIMIMIMTRFQIRAIRAIRG